MPDVAITFDARACQSLLPIELKTAVPERCSCCYSKKKKKKTFQ